MQNHVYDAAMVQLLTTQNQEGPSTSGKVRNGSSSWCGPSWPWRRQGPQHPDDAWVTVSEFFVLVTPGIGDTGDVISSTHIDSNIDPRHIDSNIDVASGRVRARAVRAGRTDR